MHTSGTNNTIYNISIKGFPLLSCIFIWTSPAFFAVAKCPSATSMYLSVSTNDPSIKSEISCVLWQVTPKSKIQLVTCELSHKSLLGVSALEYIGALYVYIFCDLFLSIMFPMSYQFFFDICAQFLGAFIIQWTLLSEVSGFRTICDEMILWSTYESRICFLTVMVITLIIIVVWIQECFLVALLFYRLIKSFSSWVLPSTLNAPWLSKMFSLVIHY